MSSWTNPADVKSGCPVLAPAVLPAARVSAKHTSTAPAIWQVDRQRISASRDVRGIGVDGLPNGSFFVRLGRLICSAAGAKDGGSKA